MDKMLKGAVLKLINNFTDTVQKDNDETNNTPDRLFIVLMP